MFRLPGVLSVYLLSKNSCELFVSAPHDLRVPRSDLGELSTNLRMFRPHRRHVYGPTYGCLVLDGRHHRTVQTALRRLLSNFLRIARRVIYFIAGNYRTLQLSHSFRDAWRGRGLFSALAGRSARVFHANWFRSSRCSRFSGPKAR